MRTHVRFTSNSFYIRHGIACLLSHVRLFATLWTVAHYAPLSIGLFRQEYWSG